MERRTKKRRRMFTLQTRIVGWVEDFDFLRSKKRNPQPTLTNAQTKSLHIIGFTEEPLCA